MSASAPTCIDPIGYGGRDGWRECILLIRLGLPEAIAEAATSAIAASASSGALSEPPYRLLGGGVLPIMDAQDGGVLDTALTGESDLLVTNNLEDFAPGVRADIAAEVVRADPAGRPNVLLLRHPNSPNRLVIASVFATKSWLLDGVALSAGVQARFF